MRKVCTKRISFKYNQPFFFSFKEEEFRMWSFQIKTCEDAVTGVPSKYWMLEKSALANIYCWLRPPKCCFDNDVAQRELIIRLWFYMNNIMNLGTHSLLVYHWTIQGCVCVCVCGGGGLTETQTIAANTRHYIAALSWKWLRLCTVIDYLPINACKLWHFKLATDVLAHTQLTSFVV